MDTASERHLDEWLAHQFTGRKTETMIARYRARMIRLVEKDPDYWLNQNWWRIFDGSK